MSFGWIVVVAIVSFLIGMAQGWVSAHGTVAEECKRLGGSLLEKKFLSVLKLVRT